MRAVFLKEKDFLCVNFPLMHGDCGVFIKIFKKS